MVSTQVHRQIEELEIILRTSFPAGVAILQEDMTPQTMSNIFYELGMMEAYGKETVIVKTK